MPSRALTEPSAAVDPLRSLALAAVDALVAGIGADAPADAADRAAAALAAARLALREAALADLPLGIVARRAGLPTAETEVLALLLALEQDEALQRRLVALTKDPARHRVELWMLRGMLGADASVVGPGSALARACLVELVPAGAFGRTILTVPPRVLWALWGDSSAEHDLPVDLQVVVAAVDADTDGVSSALVVGKDVVRRRQRAVRALGSAISLVTSPPASPEGWDALVREATLGGAAVVLETTGPLDPYGRRAIERSLHVDWAVSVEHPLALDDLPRRPWREYAASRHDPTAEEWAHAVGDDVEQLHHLTPDQLDRMRRAMALTGGDAAAAYRRLTDARLEALATHTVPRARWDDLVLSPGRKRRLQDLVLRYRNAHVVYDEWGFNAAPSRGLVALFSGPSGTGKTLAAEVVAGELGLDLYRLDLSSVVSKYIGETEKNLDELFDAADMGNTVLFFDEADSLFGKRTEVSDAHDRHANVETSYLLQRLERYDGIVVLATNYEKNIDEAFLRRVHVRVDFPLPGEPEREQLWRRNLATGAPVSADVDVEWLVRRFDISGASIRNIVVDAAFMAAGEGTEISMAHLVQGAARELQKVGRMVSKDKFGEYLDIAASVQG